MAEPEDTHWALNLAFAFFYSMCAYFYVTCLVYDPGFVPKPKGIAEQRAVIDELISLWKFDETNFCVTCMIRTPLRSKHCRRCQRCVGKHDQYVPRKDQGTKDVLTGVATALGCSTASA